MASKLDFMIWKFKRSCNLKEIRKREQFQSKKDRRLQKRRDLQKLLKKRSQGSQKSLDF